MQQGNHQKHFRPSSQLFSHVDILISSQNIAVATANTTLIAMAKASRVGKVHHCIYQSAIIMTIGRMYNH